MLKTLFGDSANTIISKNTLKEAINILSNGNAFDDFVPADLIFEELRKHPEKYYIDNNLHFNQVKDSLNYWVGRNIFFRQKWEDGTVAYKVNVRTYRESLKRNFNILREGSSITCKVKYYPKTVTVKREVRSGALDNYDLHDYGSSEYETVEEKHNAGTLAGEVMDSKGNWWKVNGSTGGDYSGAYHVSEESVTVSFGNEKYTIRGRYIYSSIGPGSYSSVFQYFKSKYNILDDILREAVDREPDSSKYPLINELWNNGGNYGKTDEDRENRREERFSKKFIPLKSNESVSIYITKDSVETNFDNQAFGEILLNQLKTSGILDYFKKISRTDPTTSGYVCLDYYGYSNSSKLYEVKTSNFMYEDEFAKGKDRIKRILADFNLTVYTNDFGRGSSIVQLHDLNSLTLETIKKEVYDALYMAQPKEIRDHIEKVISPNFSWKTTSLENLKVIYLYILNQPKEEFDSLFNNVKKRLSLMGVKLLDDDNYKSVESTPIIDNNVEDDSTPSSTKEVSLDDVEYEPKDEMRIRDILAKPSSSQITAAQKMVKLITDKDKMKRRAAAAKAIAGEDSPIYKIFKDALKESLNYKNRFRNYSMRESNLSIPHYLYHATYRPLLRGIKQKGLGNTRRKNWEDSKNGIVYLATDPYVAESYAESSDDVNEDWLDEIVILQVDTSELDKSKFSVDSNNLEGDTIQYEGIIPSECLSLFKEKYE
jgi:hypothetical protein